jgi:predicted flavoprotein YhiN
MKHFIVSLLFCGLMPVWVGPQAHEKATADTSRIPKKVMDGLVSKFSRPKIAKWTREHEGDIVVYDIEFTLGGQKFEADIKEDGTIHNWEKAIPARNLPAAVRMAVEKKYPNSRLKEIMEITVVKNGKDELEGYEIVLRTGGKSIVELTVEPDGAIPEDSVTSK